MKEQQYHWEADIRQSVEQHEFAFDPTAWAAMEQILDKTPPSPSTPTGKSIFSTISKWKWKLGFIIMSSSLIIAAILFYEAPSAPDSIPAEETTAIPTEEIDIPTTIPERVEREEIAIMKKLPAKRAIPIPQNGLRSLPDNIEVIPINTLLPLEPLITREYELLPTDSLSFPDDWQLPEGKKKRDRRRLFPDVIKKY